MDTRSCKLCGMEFSKLKGDFDGTFNEGYCNKIHRKDHERQLIREGKMESVVNYVQSLNIDVAIMKDQKYRDANGEQIWFPKDERPYFDKALGVTFHSKKEKAQYMKEKGIVMDGSSTGKLPIEAGDNRFVRYK